MLLELRSKSKFFLVLPLSFILKGTVGVENEAEKWAPLVPSGLTEVVLRTLPSLLRRSRLSDVSRILSLALTIKIVWADFPVVPETTRVLLGFVACVAGLQKGKKDRKIKARSAIERKKGSPTSTPLVLSFRPKIICANPRKPWNAWVSEPRRFAADPRRVLQFLVFRALLPRGNGRIKRHFTKTDLMDGKARSGRP